MECTIVVCQLIGSDDLEDGEGQTVDELAGQLWQYEEILSSSLVSSVEKLVQQLKEILLSTCTVPYLSYQDQVEERDTRVYWTVWIRWPGTSDPQEYNALVHTAAQCTLMPSSHKGAEPTCISEVTGGPQQLTVLETKVSLTGNEGQKHPIVTGPKAPCILGIDYLRRGYFKDPKGYWWAFGIAALEMEEIKQLSALPGLSEDPSVVGLLRVEEQRVPIATAMVHRQQYRTNRDSLIPIHKLILRKSNEEWRLTVDYRGLNEVTPPLSAAVPDMLELQIGVKVECRQGPVCFRLEGHPVHLEYSTLPQGWKHSPTICHGLIQTALEQGEAPEHLQYIDDIIVWGNTAEEVSWFNPSRQLSPTQPLAHSPPLKPGQEVFEKGKKIVQILLKAHFAVNQSRVKEPAQEIHFVGLKWQHGR
ncbi:hypothetical protein QYF61_019669 [Mycteria americana]|uniref:Uncharacterized protein n=1 Tax=Mycteria americana TaxID=33587 RepID=A0AAN7NE45_MYCAM|nr:hypothetical protein QYF61_019669 [Mycteria americana]